MVTMRLTRIGSKKRPYYRIVVIDKRRARNGRFLEVVGQYNPIANPVQMEINAERAQYWLSKGAAAVGDGTEHPSKKRTRKVI